MGKLFQCYLPGNRVWSCSNCQAHLANHEEIISKNFQGKTGKAYLFASAVNVSLGKKEMRELRTGLHTVADLHCLCCNNILGWFYEEAFVDSEKYKEGKYIIEKAMMFKDSWQ